MNKIIKTIALSIFTCALCLACGCKSENENDISVQHNVPNVAVTVNYELETIDMVIGDEMTPTISYEGADTTPVYVSSQPNIVSVDEKGKLTALATGQAVITATYEGKTDTITVNSSTGDVVPVLAFVEGVEDTIIINKNETFNLEAYVSFNGKRFDDAEISYSVDKTTGTVKGGVFSVSEIGDYQISVSANWRGIVGASLTKTVNVTARNAVELYVNDNSKTMFELYTLAEFKGEQFTHTIDFNAYGTINGESATPTVEIVSGVGHIDYDEVNGTITGVSAGETVIQVSLEGEILTVVVNTKRVKTTYEGDAIMFSAMDGTLPLEDIFGETTELVEVVDDKGNSYTVENNKILGITVTKEKPENLALTVYNNELGYTLDIIAYTKVIRTQQDLEDAFALTENNHAQYIQTNAQSGYYILANDVVGDGVTPLKVERTTGIIKGHENWQHVSQGGLTGTFDGQGYTIKNVLIYECGVFGLINGGTVKNVSFEDCQLIARKGYPKATLAHFIYNATLENVNISIDEITNDYYDTNGTVKTATSDGCGPRALVAYSVYGRVVMKNCIFSVANIAGVGAGYSPNRTYGSLFCNNKGYTAGESNIFRSQYAFTDVYVVSPHYLGVFMSSYNITEIYDDTLVDINGEDKPVGTYTASTKAYALASDVTQIKRYDTRADMKAGNHSYDTFTASGYWKLDNDGLPVWNK